MFGLVYFTHWFYEKDIIIDIFGTVVLILVLFYAWRFYKLNKEQRKYKYFIPAFGLLVLSFISKIIAHFTIYYTTTETHQIGVITVTHQALKTSNALILWGLLLHRVLMIMALYFLYLVYSEKQSKTSIFLIGYLLLVVGYLSRSVYYIFQLTALVLLAIITKKIFEVYVKNKYYKTKLLLISFGVITLSCGIFMFLYIHPIMYVIAEVVQLFGYLILLFTFSRVLLDVKKTGKN